MSGDIRRCVRCKGETLKGEECKRRTCARKDYCWQHLKTYRKVAVKKSSIPNAGMGLYAERDYKKGETVAKYSGKKVAPGSRKYKDSQYKFQYSKDSVLVSNSTQDEVGRYANTCRKKEKKDKVCAGNNARFKAHKRNGRISVRIAASKPIKKGQEIFVSYGAGFRITQSKRKSSRKRAKRRHRLQISRV